MERGCVTQNEHFLCSFRGEVTLGEVVFHVTQVTHFDPEFQVTFRKH